MTVNALRLWTLEIYYSAVLCFHDAWECWPGQGAVWQHCLFIDLTFRFLRKITFLKVLESCLKKLRFFQMPKIEFVKTIFCYIVKACWRWCCQIPTTLSKARLQCRVEICLLTDNSLSLEMLSNIRVLRLYQHCSGICMNTKGCKRELPLEIFLAQISQRFHCQNSVKESLSGRLAFGHWILIFAVDYHFWKFVPVWSGVVMQHTCHETYTAAKFKCKKNIKRYFGGK